MRFVWAVVAFVLAAVMIGAGLAQRTIFQGPKTETTQLQVEQDAPFTMIDGAVLNRLPGSQTLRAQSDGTIFVSYGRTADLQAWLSDTPYNEISLDSAGLPVATLVEPEVEAVEEAPADAEAGAATEAPAEGETDAAAEDAGEAVRSPVGSDLWLDEFQEDDLLIAPLQLPDTMSVLVASDGAEPAPAQLSVSWPIQNSTPWAGPLIVLGGIVMLVGAFLYFLGIRNARRSRGPRRKGLPMPVTEPIDLAVEGADKGVITAGKPTRRGIAGRKAFVALPIIAITGLLVSGCSAESWPTFGPSPTPSPTQTVIAPEDQQDPAITATQAERIITRISETMADADSTMDATLAATRMGGAALAERATNYKLRAAIADYALPSSVPTKPLEIVLPQATNEWPRVVMAVATDADDKTASIMYLTQEDPWSAYKLTYLAALEAATEMPNLAPDYIGATRVAPDSPFLLMAPDQIAAAYADILDKGEESEFYAAFEAEGDQFRTIVSEDRARRIQEFNATGATTGSLAFGSTPGTETPIALATVESGAIVAVNLNETDTVKPVSAEAVIKLTNNATVRTLTGVEQSATGFTSTFGDQLFFYVPAQGSTEKIRLLGYSSSILDAQVIK